MANTERKGELCVYIVTVERERLVKETRKVRVIARSEYGAKMLAKQKRPNDGWVQESVNRNLNSPETTRFSGGVAEYIGPAKGLPNDPQKRHALLNDSAFVVKIEGEY